MSIESFAKQVELEIADLRAQLAAERERADKAEAAKVLLEADLVKRGMEKGQLLNDLAAAKADVERYVIKQTVRDFIDAARAKKGE